MSNLLKDASILLTPTAYENGRMNAIKPYKDLYGSELVTNGDFSNGLTSWTAYGVTSVSSGIVTIGASSNSGIFQGILTQGKKYKATINVTSYNGVGNAQVTNDNGGVLYTITTAGLQTFYFEHSISNANVIVRATASGVLSISSFSVVEDLSGDFTFSRNSAATRVNAQGLVENVQIISDELVSNGDFSQIGTEEVSNGDFSQIGAEEVSNGNFSQEGSELITNGDFATDSNWNGTNTNGVTISNGSLNYSETTLNHNVSQSNVVTIGKSYKVTLTISNYVKGSVLIIVGAGGSIQEVSSNGTFTMYGVASINNTFYLQARGVNGTSLSIDNISVKEVGQDWTLSNGSISDKYNASMTAYQSGIKITPFVKTGNYKVVFDLVITSGSCKFDAGGGNDEIYTTSGTKEILITNPTKFEFNAFNLGWVGTIDNVSVKEVGQDWSLGADWSIGDDKAVRVGTSAGNLTQSPFTVGKTYKVSWEQSNGFIAVYGNTLSTLLSNTGDEGVRIVYFTPTSSSRLDFRSTDDDAEVTNISVKEVGQDWTFGTGATMGGGKVVADGTGGNYDNIIYQDTNVSFANKKFKIKFDVLDYVSGKMRVSAGNSAVTPHVEANGSYEFISNVSAGNDILYFINYQVPFVGSITNVSVKEITDDTDLPRINYEGFSYQDSLGSELVTNGDFANWTNDNPDNYNVLNENANNYVTESNGQLRMVSDNSATIAIRPEPNTMLTVGKIYKVSVDLTFTTGTVDISAVQFNTSGTKVFYLTAPAPYLQIAKASALDVLIDNVSVKEYLGQEVVPDSGCGSWLLEPQSTNLITYSEDFSNAYWAKSSVTLTSGFAAPDGSNNAYKIQGTINTSYIGRLSADTNQRSIYARTVSGTANINLLGDNSGFTVTEDWQRFEYNPTSNTYNFAVDFRNGTNATEVLIWGYQSENQSYATSYIPTNGATSTRLQDIANNSGNSTLINSTEGVLYAEIAALAENEGNRCITISANSSNKVMLRFGTLNRVQVFVVANGALVSNELHTLTNITDFNKFAFKYKSGDNRLFVNGSKVDDNNDTFSFTSDLNKVNFNEDGGQNFFGKNKALAVYKEALTDANLRCLTYPNPVATTFDLDFDTIAEQFTFTRGSEATFVNEQGLIESTNQIGPELVTNGDFATDSDWNKGSGWSISGGKANANTVGSFVNLRTNSSVVEPSKIYDVSFDVSNYTQGSVRLSFIQSVATSQVSANGTYTARLVASSAGSSQVYIQGINSFIGSIDNVSVKEVTTATNTPRIDYSTGEKAFLLEPQSTNLITYSEDFGSGSGWVKFASGISFDANTTETLSPQGLYNATKIISSVNNEQQAIYKSYSIATPTISCYAKAAEFDTFNLKTSGGVSCNFTLTGDGEIGYNTNTSAKSIEYLGNGWYRCSISSSTNSTYAWISIDGGSIQGDGTSGIYIWGAQLEQLSYPTSYIPTAGATATRNQELCNNATPVINSEEGTLYAEISALEDDLTFRGLSISDGTTSNACRIYYRNSSNRVQFLFNVGGASQFQQLIDLTNIKDYNKIAFSYKKNNFKVYINGVKVAEDTNGIVPSANTFNKLSFSRADGGESFFGNTKGLKVYPKALADVQLEDLTTI